MFSTTIRLIIFYLFVAAASAFGQARFQVEGGLERHLGIVPLHDLHDTITIINPGTAPLHIIGMNPTCGCTAAILDTNVIPPHGKAHVYIKIEPPDVMGKIHKTIEFLTNDLSNPKQIVGFGFEIFRDLGATPRQYAFAGCRINQPCEQSVMLYNISENPVGVIREPMTMPGLHSLMPDSLVLPAHDSVMYKLQLTSKSTGLTSGKFRLRTTSKSNPTMEFSVFANVADKNGVPDMPKMK